MGVVNGFVLGVRVKAVEAQGQVVIAVAFFCSLNHPSCFQLVCVSSLSLLKVIKTECSITFDRMRRTQAREGSWVVGYL